MKYNFLKYYKSNFLIFLIGFLILLIYYSKNYWNLSISIFSIASTLMIFITTFLWKYKPFKWLFWIDDFSGRYEGFIKYQYRDESGNIKTGKLKHVKIINQNGSRITISSFTFKKNGKKSSLSLNNGIYVEKTDDDQHYNLIYSYLNKGDLKQDFAPHYGTDIIKFINNNNQKILSGEYYTDRKPYQTRGEYYKLKWISNNLNHEF